MKFLILIPTIRQSLDGFEETMASVRASFTLPTDFRVLDGRKGKAQTLNQALTEILPESDCDVYVTLDDDYVPSVGWQDEIAKAFRVLPKVGVLGLWLGESPEMQAYMYASESVQAPKKVDGLTIRMLHRGRNIPGAMLAFRKELALAIGPTPVGEEKYQVYEDSYRCGRAWTLDSGVAYVDVRPLPRIVEYRDTKEYLETKDKDIASASANMDAYMTGIQRRRDRVLAPLRRLLRLGKP